MNSRRLAGLAVAISLSFCASGASADPATDKAKQLGKKLLIGKWIKAKGIMYSVGAGWEATDLVGVSAEIGYAWGRQRTGLSNAASLHHVAIAPRLITPADDFDVNIEVAAMLGHTWRALAYVSFEAGPNFRFSPDVEAGVLARARVGYRQYGLYLYAGASFGDDTDGIVGLGVELFRLPSLNLVETVKHTLQP